MKKHKRQTIRQLRKTLARVLRGFDERIEALGMTKKDFSEVTGISYDTIKRLKNPTISTLLRIDEALFELEARQ